MKAIRLGLLAASLVVAGSAYADAYLGAGMGRSSVDSSEDGISFDDTDTGWKFFGGYAFNENIAVEGAWVDIGDFTDNVSVPALGVNKMSLDIDGFAVSGVGSLPVGDSAAVFGKLGIWSWNADGKVVGVSADDSGTDVMFGVGGSYSFTDAISVRAEWERFKADSDDADLLSVSGVFNF